VKKDDVMPKKKEKYIQFPTHHTAPLDIHGKVKKRGLDFYDKFRDGKNRAYFGIWDNIEDDN